MIIVWILILIVSLAVLIVGANWLTRSGERLGQRFHISPFIIGVTVVAIGTSLPELITSLIAVFRSTAIEETTQIVLGNVVGSNIANILLIGGVSAVLARTLVIKRSLIDLDLPLLLLSAVLLWIFIADGEVTFVEAIFLIVGFGGYLHYTIQSHKKESVDSNIEPTLHQPAREHMHHSMRSIIVGLVIGAGLLYLGADYAIQAVIELSELLGFSTSTLALTAVAIGTSLPEVTVSALAALRKSSDVAIGNIIGSNIFNTFLVVGIPGLFSQLVVTSDVITFAMPIMLFATLLFVVSTLTKKVYIYEGFFYLLAYAAFLGKVFNMF